ncbi:MAG TPA: DUF1579 domain-containing protein [Planctomicrobium sp.]|nr:DUF1579 domain-containing protein [Planctomicrobium sp.]
MFEKPQSEHAWLEQLVGRWISEGECFMGPDQEPQKNSGRMNCRSLGGLWLIGEGEGDGNSPEEKWSSIITLGYDIKQQRYVGTFVASMMTHLWLYKGVLDASGKKLPLDSEGPRFDGNGTTQYRDTIEIVDQDHWIFSGEVLTDDGSWQTIMTSHNRRE